MILSNWYRKVDSIETLLFVDECDVKLKENGLSYKKFNSEKYLKAIFRQSNCPGVIIRGYGQTAGIVVSYREYKDKSVLFIVLISKQKTYFVEDKIVLVKFMNKVRDVYKFFGIAFNNNIKVSEAEFSAMITYK